MQRAADRESSVKEREAENTKMQSNLLHIRHEHCEAANDFVFPNVIEKTLRGIKIGIG